MESWGNDQRGCPLTSTPLSVHFWMASTQELKESRMAHWFSAIPFSFSTKEGNDRPALPPRTKKLSLDWSEILD